MKTILAAIFLALSTPAAATSYTLTVSTLGPVSPSIITSSNPVTGIWCGSTHTACSTSFPAASTVTLSEITASTMAFAGWANGGCSGHTTCVVVSSSTYQGLGGNQSPAAWFYPVGY